MMTLYRKIKEVWDEKDIATFITMLIQETEDKMLCKLSEYGIEVSIARPAYGIAVANNLMMLLEEVPEDANTEDA